MPDKSFNCPECQSSNTYEDGNFWTCPECFHEWIPEKANSTTESEVQEAIQFLDSNGVKLESGDTVATIKDLKLGKETLKSGTKVKNIRLLDSPVDGHDISCKMPGHGSIYLKCTVVKKV